MMRHKRVLIIPLLLLTFLFMAQYGRGQSTETATPTSRVEVSAEMEPVPADCGILAEPMTIDPLITRAIGAWPIWVALPNSSDADKGVLVVPNQHDFTSPDLEGWWTTKVAWFIPQSYTGEVHLRGFNVADNSPIYFEFSSHKPSEVATLNPEQPGGFVEELDDWAFFPSHLWVSKAGCYRLEAEWDGGRWQQIIAVGNME